MYASPGVKRERSSTAYPKSKVQSMDMADGGKIEQRVCPGTNSAILYDDENVDRLWIHTISSEDWGSITGVVPPLIPSPPSPLYGAFDKPQSITTLDSSKQSELTPSGVEFFDFDALRPYISHRASTSPCVFCPCSHTACDACIDKTTADAKCPHCDEMTETFVGSKELININIGAGSAGNWRHIGDQTQGVDLGDQNLISLFS